MMGDQVTRACGHVETYQPRGGPYEGRRREKFDGQQLCHECRVAAGIAKNAADSASEATRRANKVKKGSEVKELPAGSVVVLRRNEDGWVGSLAVGGRTIDGQAAGLMSLISKLARKYVSSTGKTVSGVVKE